MSSVKEYFSGIGQGVTSLLKGMGVTGKELFTKKVTEEYPDNRDNLNIGERFRGTLELIYDENGNHKCIGCGLCQMSCPNGTIQVITKMVEMPDGKKKRKLDKYIYDLGSCTFCQLCESSCPHGALRFVNDFNTRSIPARNLSSNLTISQNPNPRRLLHPQLLPTTLNNFAGRT